MPRWLHGRVEVTEETLNEAREAITERIADVGPGFAVVNRVEFKQPFDFLFLELQHNLDNLLPEAKKTRDDLVALGEAMADSGRDAAGDSSCSAAYTYFGQFVDHDITLEKSAQPGMRPPVEPDLTPLPLQDTREQKKNMRAATLTLDSIYGLPAPRKGERMEIGKVTEINGTYEPFFRPPGKDDENDLPRRRPDDDPRRDREALIGDPRNDDNTIIAQLHVAFLRAHNALIDEGETFDGARSLLQQHYQHVVIHDFLKQIAEPSIVDDIVENGNRVYKPDEDEFFMPLEFSVAAYRFGHSMVRAEYDFNLNFNRTTFPASLGLLFGKTALSGELARAPVTLPENWIIEWENFFEGGQFFNKARKIDTQLVEPLQHLQNIEGEDEPDLAAKLAVRNLLRGYLLRMPTGQAVARALRKKLQGVRDIPVLSPQQIKDAAASNKQRRLLDDSGFDERTPLWYYILAEAAVLEGGECLGPVGSTIVAEVLVGLVRRSEHSILRADNWETTLPSARRGMFALTDLLRLAGVL
jgi:hypothetical protein